MEQRLITGHLLWNLDVYLADDAVEWSQEGEIRHMRVFLKTGKVGPEHSASRRSK